MSYVTYVVDLGGDRHDINLNDNVLATDVFNPEGKVVTDSVVNEAFDDFKSDNFTDDADFSNTDKVPTGRAVASYVQNELSGQGGGFLGNKSVAEINAMTAIELHTGDSACMTDGGTITIGGVVVVEGDEIVFTTSSVWVKKLTTYVRPADYATSLRGGTIRSSETGDSYVKVNSDGTAYVNGWSGKANNSRGGLVALAHKASIGTSILSTDEDIFEVCAIPTTASGGSVPYLYTWTKIWTWIAGKISSVLGLTASDYDGNANTATTATSSNYVNDYAWTSSASTNQGLQVGWANSAVTECTPDSSLTATTSHNLCCYIKSGNQVMLKDVDISDVKSGDSDKVDGYHIDVVTSGTISTASDHITFLRYVS